MGMTWGGLLSVLLWSLSERVRASGFELPGVFPGEEAVFDAADGF